MSPRDDGPLTSDLDPRKIGMHSQNEVLAMVQRGSSVGTAKQTSSSKMQMVNTNTAMTSKKSKQTNEAIKVCIRVRPLLNHERMADEVVYYPDSNDASL